MPILPAFPFELVTERLVIRAPAADDAPAFVEAVAESLAELGPWMPWADHVPTLEEARENCAAAEARFRDGSDHRVHLFLRDGGTFVGCSGLHRADWTVPKVEIGYWIRTSLTGRGYATEAARELTRYALDELGVQRVEIRMNTRNERSRRVPARLGFTLEGILRNDEREVGGALRDTCVWSRVPGR